MTTTEKKMQEIRRTFIVTADGEVYGLNQSALEQAEQKLFRNPQLSVNDILAAIPLPEPQMTAPTI